MFQRFIQPYEGASILVTGAGGYIGYQFVKSLLTIDCRIIRFSRRKLQPISDCVAQVEDIQGDLENFNDWFMVLSKVDYIFHFAAQTGIKNADNSPMYDAQVNVLATLRLLEAAKQHTGKVLILAGTTTECGVPSCTTVSEDLPDVPETLYDLHKLMAENYLKYFCRRDWVRGVCLRLANVYGPGVCSANQTRGVLNQVIRNAIAGKNIFTFDGGSFIRDYIFIDDVICAFLLAGQHIQSLNGVYYLIGTGVGTSIKEAFSLVVDLVKRKLNVSVNVLNRDLPNGLLPVDRRHCIVNSEAFSEKTGWQSVTPLELGIDATINAYTSSYQEASCIRE